VIAIDTNVLLRYLLWDDKEQAEKADSLIKGASGVLITDVVLVEMVWTLRGKRYKLSKMEIIKVIDKLFEEKNIHFENAQVLWQALADYKKAHTIKSGVNSKTADFAGSLILNKAKYLAKIKLEEFEGFYTFDLAAQNLSGTRKL